MKPRIGRCGTTIGALFLLGLLLLLNALWFNHPLLISEVGVTTNKSLILEAGVATNKKLIFVNSNEMHRNDELYPRKFTLKANPTPAQPERDLEHGTTQHWTMPDTCVGGTNHKFWNAERAEDAVVKEYTDAYVWRDGETTYFSYNGVFSNSQRCSGGASKAPLTNISLSRLAQRSKSQYPHAILLASQHDADDIFHFLQEKAMVLGLFRDLLDDAKLKPIYVLIDYPVATRFRKFCMLLGLDRFQFIAQVDGASPVLVKHLYVPYAQLCNTGSSAPAIKTRKWLYEFNPQEYANQNYAMDILVLDCKENGHCPINGGCLQNSLQVAQALRIAFPQRTVRHATLEYLTTNKTLQLFSSAEVLVSPHCSGLAYLNLLPRHAKVVEISNVRQQCNLKYYSMSLSLGLQHRVLLPLKLKKNGIDFTKADVPCTVLTVRDLLSLKTG